MRVMTKVEIPYRSGRGVDLKWPFPFTDEKNVRASRTEKGLGERLIRPFFPRLRERITPILLMQAPDPPCSKLFIHETGTATGLGRMGSKRCMAKASETNWPGRKRAIRHINFHA